MLENPWPATSTGARVCPTGRRSTSALSSANWAGRAASRATSRASCVGIQAEVLSSRHRALGRTSTRTTACPAEEVLRHFLTGEDTGWKTQPRCSSRCAPGEKFVDAEKSGVGARGGPSSTEPATRVWPRPVGRPGRTYDPGEGVTFLTPSLPRDRDHGPSRRSSSSLADQGRDLFLIVPRVHAELPEVVSRGALDPTRRSPGVLPPRTASSSEADAALRHTTRTTSGSRSRRGIYELDVEVWRPRSLVAGGYRIGLTARAGTTSIRGRVRLGTSAPSSPASVLPAQRPRDRPPRSS